MFLKTLDRARQHLFHQPADNFNAGQIPFVRGAIKCLSGKGFLMERTIWIPVKKATNLIFQLMNTGHRGFA